MKIKELQYIMSSHLLYLVEIGLITYKDIDKYSWDILNNNFIRKFNMSDTKYLLGSDKEI
jgi:hypothetical protein